MFITFRNSSFTLPFENRKDIARIGLSPNDTLLVSVDTGYQIIHFFKQLILNSSLRYLLFCFSDGRCVLSNLKRRCVLHHFNFGAKVRDIQFSPSGEFIAVTRENHVKVSLSVASKVCTRLKCLPFAFPSLYVSVSVWCHAISE